MTAPDWSEFVLHVDGWDGEELYVECPEDRYMISIDKWCQGPVTLADLKAAAEAHIAEHHPAAPAAPVEEA